MRAVVLTRYGGPEALEVREVPLPEFQEDEVLVRVVAASVNPVDEFTVDPPLFLRRGQGFLRPRTGRVGLDLAGRVEAVGRAVTEFRVGDEVLGVGHGAFAEYSNADQTQLVRKPPGLSFEEAAAVPVAATTALQGLRDQAGVRPGMKVLINGASGGVGTFAVQIALALGAEVSCVCSPGKVEWNRSLGVVRVFDYTREDFTRSGPQYDVIFDTHMNHPLAAYRRVLAPHGVLLMVGVGSGSGARLVGRLLKVLLGSRLLGPKTKFFVAHVDRGSLVPLGDLLAAGKVRPVIDRRYPLSEVAAALKYLAEGHAQGKLVLTV